MTIKQFVTLKKFFVPVLIFLFICLVVWIVKVQDTSQINATNTEVLDNLEDASREQASLFNEFLRRQSRHLNFLKDTPPIQGINRTRANDGVDPLDGTYLAQWENRLAAIFTSLAGNYADIMQLRLIDANSGKELVRVDLLGNSIKRIPAAKLQNKFEHDYVQQTIKLSEGTIYTSELNLNRENGAIEYPLKPTIRFATPIYDQNNQLQTLLVINVTPRQLIDTLQSISNSHDAQFLLLDQDGHIIEHPNANLQFTKDLSPETTLTSVYQNLPWHWQNLSLLKQQDEASYLSYSQTLKFAPAAIGGASQFQLINMFPRDDFDALLFDKRLSSLGYLAVFILGVAVVSTFLFSYTRSLAQLRRTRTEFEAIIQGASDGIIAVNNQLELETFNLAAIELFPALGSISGKESLANTEIFPAEIVEKVKKYKDLKNIDFTIKAPASGRDIRIKTSPILDENYQKIGNALFM
ncbi:hypothetical protein [Colwellia sp. MEBiC06753]